MVTVTERPAPAPAPPGRQPSRTAGLAWKGTTGILILLVMILALTPLLYLLWDAFHGDGSFSLGAFKRAYVDTPGASGMVWNSIAFATGSTVLGFAIGAGLAFLQARTNIRMKGLLFTIGVIPMAISPLLYATAWIFIANPTNGVFNEITDAVIGVRPFNIYGIWGMIWVQGTHLSPLAFLFMVGAFSTMDPSLEESALVSGATRTRIYRKITGPLLMASSAASMLLLFVQSIESFEVPGILGVRDNTYVFTSQLYYLLQRFPPDPQAAAALSIGLLLIAVLAFALSSWISRRRNAATVTGKAYRPALIQLGRLRGFWGGVVIFYFVLTVVLPSAMLLYASFLPFYETPSLDALKNFTLANYSALRDPNEMSAFKNTAVLAVLSGVIVMVLTVITAWYTSRIKRKYGAVIEAVTFSPIMIPGIVLGVALSFVFLRVFTSVYATLWIILIAFIIKYLPYGMRYAVSAMGQVSGELSESAEVSGASQASVLKRVTLPLIKDSVLGGFLLVFVLAFREVSSSVILFSPGNQTVGVLMWQHVQDGEFVRLAAVGTTITVILAVVIFIGYKFSKSFGVQAH